jgi:hypothetical protein
VYLVPKISIDDWIVFAGVRSALMHRLTEIDLIVQDPIQVALLDRFALFVQRAFFR